ncbi:MAG: hypothetical protein M3041_05865 [Acidobacteriota bacterium]|nr:hypothetical protein [Acidobacteriota bacterium]
MPETNLQELAEKYWIARDYQQVVSTLEQLQVTATKTPDPADRAKLADGVRHFLTVERLNILFLDFIGGAMPAAIATRIWNLVPDEVIWPILLDAWTRLPEGENRSLVLAALRDRLAGNGELLHRGRPPENLLRLLR